MSIDLLYKRGLIAISATLSVLYLSAYWSTDGVRSPLAIVGIFGIASLIARTPNWIESVMSQTTRRISSGRSVLLSIKTTAWGPQGLESEEVMRASDSYNGDHVNLSISFNPRTVDRLEISPIRRPLDEIDGIVRDAERLANDPQS